MAKTKVRVTIGGTDYSFMTDDNPEYVIQIAEQVDQQLDELMKRNKWLSLNKAAIYVAVDAQDRARQERSNAEHLRAQMKEYLADSARCRSETEEARREIERLRAELKKRDLRIAELSAQENENQKTGSDNELEAQTRIELPSGKIRDGKTPAKENTAPTTEEKSEGISPDEFIHMIDTLSGQKQ